MNNIQDDFFSFEDVDKLREQQYGRILGQIIQVYEYVYNNIELFSPSDTDIHSAKKKKKPPTEPRIMDEKTDKSIYGFTSYSLNPEDLETLSYIVEPDEHMSSVERSFRHNNNIIENVHVMFCKIHESIARLEVNSFDLHYEFIQKIESMLESFIHHDHSLLVRGIAALEHAYYEDGKKIPFHKNKPLDEIFYLTSEPFFFTDQYVSMIVRVLKKYSSMMGNKTMGSQNPVLMNYYVRYVGHLYHLEENRLEDAKELYALDMCTGTDLFKQYQRTLQKQTEYAEIAHKGGLFQTEKMEVHNLEQLHKEVQEFYEKELQPVIDTLSQKNIKLYLENFSNVIHYLLHGNLNRKKVLLALQQPSAMNPLKFHAIIENARKSLETFQEHVDSFHNTAIPLEERLRKLEDAKHLFEKLLDINLQYLDTIDEDYHD